MKLFPILFLFFLSIVCSSIISAQSVNTPQTSYIVIAVSDMQAYSGKANRIFILSENREYAECNSCTVDNALVFLGTGIGNVGTRNWRQIRDSSTTTDIYNSIYNVFNYFTDTSYTNQFQPRHNTLDSLFKRDDSTNTLRSVYSDGQIVDIDLSLLINQATISQFISIFNYMDSISIKDTTFLVNHGQIGGNNIVYATQDLLSENDSLHFNLYPEGHAGEFLTTDGTNYMWAAASGSNTDSLFGVTDNIAQQNRLFNFNSRSFKFTNVQSQTTIDSSSYVMLLQEDSIKRIPAGYFVPNIHPDICLTGCTVTLSDTATNSYTYVIAASTYYKNNVFHSSVQTTVTLDPSDLTNDRVDLFVLQSSNTSTDITGTAANPALDPDYDANTQLPIGRATISAGSVAPTIITKVLYKENLGPTAEYTAASSHVSINVNSTNNPWAGSKDIEFTSVTNGRSLTLTWTGTIDFSDVNNLIFRIRSKANWQTRKLVMQWMNGTTPVGVAIPFGQSSYGFSSTNTANYQLIDISISDFGNITGATKLRMTVSSPSGSLGLYLDNIMLVSESLISSPTGILAVNGISPISVTTVNNVATISSTMNNTGSGFRILAGNKASIKTLSGSNTISIDSSSNSNSLTLKADTSVLATQYDLTQIVAGRFGIEDNTGIQNRQVLMDQFDFKVREATNVQLYANDITGDLSSGLFETVDGGTPSLQLNVGGNTGGSEVLLTEAGIRLGWNGDLFISTPNTIGSFVMPVTVNGNSADATGNITTSTGGGNQVTGQEFTGSTSTTLTLSQTYISGTIKLYKNGVRLLIADFTEATGTTITLNVARLSGDVFQADFNY